MYKKYEIIINEKNIDLNIKFDEDEFYIKADESSIEIVLDNLISNAIKYNTDNEIDIFLLKDKNEIVLSVKNGVENIDKNKINNIWKSFYVLEESRSKEISGTGLGLSIVKEILEVHDFKYGVDIKEGKIEFFIRFSNLDK